MFDHYIGILISLAQSVMKYFGLFQLIPPWHIFTSIFSAIDSTLLYLFAGTELYFNNTNILFGIQVQTYGNLHDICQICKIQLQILLRFQKIPDRNL